MGLIETINRRAAKYGLVSKLIGALPSISCILFLVGVAWLAVLPMEGQYRRNYISENALLPGQVNTHFRETEWDIVRGYRQEVHLLEDASEEVRAATVSEWFEKIGLKTSVHSWSVEHGDERMNGSNVYGILHAPRGDTTGAIVLVAPWINQDGNYNDGGIALLVSLSKYLKRWSVWSKNIIFVAPSDTRFALREWVTAYHTSLKNTAGSIEGALILDYESKTDYFDLVEVQYDGLNGQLPNLDLVNTCVQASNYEGLNVIIHGQHSSYNTYKERAKTFGLGLLSQLMAGIERGPGSECFSGWRIDAVTIRAIGTSGPQDITTFGRIVESSLRSINNLLEHFHQSFFFYHLLTPKNFVSIGTYLPAAMCIAQSFPLMAAFKWIKGAKAFSESANSSDSKMRMVILTPIAFYGFLYALCWSFSYLCGSMTTSKISSFYSTVGLIIQSIPIVSLILPVSLINFPLYTSLLLQSVALVIHGVLLTTLSTVNFSLAFFIGLVTFPLQWIEASESLRKQVKNIIILTIFSPFNALLLLMRYYSIVYHGDHSNELLEGLLWAWRSMDVWTWGIIVGLWMPLWLVSVVSSCAPKNR